jgi:hypothetical protein
MHRSNILSPVAPPGAMMSISFESEEVILRKLRERLRRMTDEELQAEWWLNYMKTRTRKPLASSTYETWRCCLDKWLLPTLGDLPLSAVDNDPVKELVGKMVVSKELGPKSTNEYIKYRRVRQRPKNPQAIVSGVLGSRIPRPSHRGKEEPETSRVRQ